MAFTVNVKHPCFVSHAFSSLGETDNGHLARGLKDYGSILFRIDALTNELDCCKDAIRIAESEIEHKRQYADRLKKHRKLASFEQAERLRMAIYELNCCKSRRAALKERIKILERLLRAGFSY